MKNQQKCTRNSVRQGLTSNEMFSTAFDCCKPPSSLFYSMDMGVPFGERGKAEVLSAMRNKRKRCCGHGGGLLFYALFCARMVTFVTMRQERVKGIRCE